MMATSTRNPFPGIRPFEEYESHLFFGRDEQIEYLKTSLKKYFVAVLGGSGSGKSSLVRAGLLPQLSREEWDIAIFKPQNVPLLNLCSALKSINWEMNSDETFTDLISINLDLSSNGIVETYLQSGTKKRLLLIVDQFEEIFIFKDQRIDNERDAKRTEEALKFVQLLIQAAKSNVPICVLITMRSEFLGNCADFKGLPELINEGQFLLPRLTRSQFKDAIVKPIEKCGASVSSTLISQMLNDIEDDPDQLPVLQHSLMRMWNAGELTGTTPLHFTVDHYNAVGGMANAINAHADEVYISLPEELRGKTKAIFQRITEKKASGVSVRSPKALEELTALTGNVAKDAEQIINAFRKEGVNFLLPSESISLERFHSIDISHESLIRKWKRLNKWIDEEEVDKGTLFRLIDRERDFRHDKKAYLQGAILSYYLRWDKYKTATEHETKIWAERYTMRFTELIGFVAESHLINEEAVQKARAKQRKQRIIFATLGTVVIVSIIAVLYFSLQATKNKKDLLMQVLSSNSLAQENLDLRKKYYVLYDSFSDILLKRDNVLSSSANEQGNAILQLNKELVAAKRDLEGTRYQNSKLETNLKEKNADSTKLAMNFVERINSLESANTKLRSENAAVNQEYNAVLSSSDLLLQYTRILERGLPEGFINKSEHELISKSNSSFDPRLKELRKKSTIYLAAGTGEIDVATLKTLSQEYPNIEVEKGIFDEKQTVIYYYRASDLSLALDLKIFLYDKGIDKVHITPIQEKSPREGVMLVFASGASALPGKSYKNSK